MTVHHYHRVQRQIDHHVRVTRTQPIRPTLNTYRSRSYPARTP
jgi:hypothetical protein